MSDAHLDTGVATRQRINRIITGDDIGALVARVDKTGSVPIQFNLYFSYLPETELDEIPRLGKFEEGTFSMLKDMRRELTRVVYSSMVSLTFAAINMSAYKDMAESISSFERQLGDSIELTTQER